MVAKWRYSSGDSKLTRSIQRSLCQECHHGIARGAVSPTEVPCIEPVPVLKLVPGLPPAEEIVVAAVFLVETPLLAQLQLKWETRWYQGDLMDDSVRVL